MVVKESVLVTKQYADVKTDLVALTVELFIKTNTLSSVFLDFRFYVLDSLKCLLEAS